MVKRLRGIANQLHGAPKNGKFRWAQKMQFQHR